MRFILEAISQINICILQHSYSGIWQSGNLTSISDIIIRVPPLCLKALYADYPKTARSSPREVGLFLGK